MKKLLSQNDSSWGKDLFIILATFFVLYFSMIWVRPLASPDEGRYTQIPLEMIRAADYVTPTLNDVAYFYKPPLVYWLSALSIKIFGENLFAFRFANTAISLLGLAFTYCAARGLYGRLAGIFSSIALGTSIFYFALGQVITLDMAVSVFIAGAMFSFIVALKRSGVWRGVLILLFFLSSALAVMSKGLIGALIPAATIFLYAVAIGISTFIKKFKSQDLWWGVGGVAIFLAVVLPWHILVSLANPAYENAGGIFSTEWEGQCFFWYYIVHEHFLRFIDPNTSGREEPFWYFFALAPLGFIPYLFFLPSAIKDTFIGGFKKVRKENPEIIFFLIWSIFVVLFFSASSSKLPPYILPIYPALAVIFGRWFAEVWESGKFSRVNIVAKILLAGGYVATLAPIVIYFILEHKGKLLEKAPEMFEVSATLSVLMGLATSLALYFLIKRNDKAFWIFALVAMCVLLSMINPMGRFLQRESTRELVEEISSIRRADDTFAIAYSYGVFQDFPVWLKQPVYMIGDVPEEQKFGYMRANDEKKKKFINSDEDFKKLLSTVKGNVYIAIKKSELERLEEEIDEEFVEVARARVLLLLKVVR